MIFPICFISPTACAMRLHILTKDSKILTRSGQNLTLPCVAKGKNFDAFSNPLIWYKVADNGEEFQVCGRKSRLYYLSLLNIDGALSTSSTGPPGWNTKQILKLFPRTSRVATEALLAPDEVRYNGMTGEYEV